MFFVCVRIFYRLKPINTNVINEMLVTLQYNSGGKHVISNGQYVHFQLIYCKCKLLRIRKRNSDAALIGDRFENYVALPTSLLHIARYCLALRHVDGDRLLEL